MCHPVESSLSHAVVLAQATGVFLSLGIRSRACWHRVDPGHGLVPVGLAVGEMGSTEGTVAELLLCGQNLGSTCRPCLGDGV